MNKLGLSLMIVFGCISMAWGQYGGPPQGGPPQQARPGGSQPASGPPLVVSKDHRNYYLSSYVTRCTGYNIDIDSKKGTVLVNNQPTVMRPVFYQGGVYVPIEPMRTMTGEDMLNPENWSSGYQKNTYQDPLLSKEYEARFKQIKKDTPGTKVPDFTIMREIEDMTPAHPFMRSGAMAPQAHIATDATSSHHVPDHMKPGAAPRMKPVDLYRLPRGLGDRSSVAVMEKPHEATVASIEKADRTASFRPATHQDDKLELGVRSLATTGRIGSLTAASNMRFVIISYTVNNRTGMSVAFPLMTLEDNRGMSYLPRKDLSQVQSSSLAPGSPVRGRLVYEIHHAYYPQTLKVQGHDIDVPLYGSGPR